jgi:hypothetical protein
MTYPTDAVTVASGPSDKSRGIALVLAFLLGLFGAHRFYVGKHKSGALMALTIGGAGIWYLYDLILVAAGVFRDAEGRVVSEWEESSEPRQAALPADVADELYALRQEMAELQERVDFAERLLTRGDRTELTRIRDEQQR